MKNSKLLKIAVFSLLTVTFSCREELTEASADKANVIEQATVKNGRLYFPNKESLNATYADLKKKDPETVQHFIEEKGIESLVPVITNKNENEVISELKSRKIGSLQKTSSMLMRGESVSPVSDEDIYDDLDDLEEVVGDEVYASMLNGSAEIQIADKIYKYTDAGMFVTTEQNYSRLQNYLEVRRISPDLLIPTEASVREQFITDMPSGELVTLPNTDNTISYFSSPVDRRSGANGGFRDGGDGGFRGGDGNTGPRTGGNGGFRNPPTTTPQPQEPSIATIVQNLPIGEVRKPWLGNVFGKTWTTYDKYESKRRVKVKFYSQNLYLVYAVGCKVKHQYKGWTGLWRKENAEKLGIGINSISWKFSHSLTYASNNTPREVYWVDGKMYKAANNTDYVNVGPATMPTFPFSKNATVDAVIQFTTNLSGLTEEQLNKLFWENAWKQANKFMEGQNKKLNRVAFVVDSYEQTYIQYYDFSQIEDNQDVIERIFNWGVATPQFTYTFGGGTGTGVAVTSYKFDFLQPTAVAVSMYGIAKKNGAWHGVKLNAK
ncbi:hypothetical protein C1637_14070 [Chryseobacterium lactis]|uniref:Lipoprotein n=1 Tax=Chryseobacterium lactis TaxID=1241981 RepID=A0A3G6RMC8_CHRLC|nr:hypothetical protein [Chryseobacterium lactis]AZA83752.1 hypothetical protein EG342_18495 [Chryseobacterium lactis]AZB04137.1 hypothetical protein EG341_09370 [Chryseobacterium lactis]PNW12954.1 hypothetical protein C1637_14070 [Chryseobacterium lactis]